MNTSRKGAEYERAYRHDLEKRGYVVTRSAASKGPWDLVAVRVDAEQRARFDAIANDCLHVQLKSSKHSCRWAAAYASTLFGEVPWPCRVSVVHPVRGTPFCEHLG